MAEKVMATKDEKHFIFLLTKTMKNVRKRFFYLKGFHALPEANSAEKKEARTRRVKLSN